jgi:hypothetical protein
MQPFRPERRRKLTGPFRLARPTPWLSPLAKQRASPKSPRNSQRLPPVAVVDSWLRRRYTVRGYVDRQGARRQTLS